MMVLRKRELRLRKRRGAGEVKEPGSECSRKRERWKLMEVENGMSFQEGWWGE